MKSLMEEASSIAKAIENGWIRAGKPKEFTVKVHEEPVKNFFGITTQPAKVGIFFTETIEAEPKYKAKPARQPLKPREVQPREVNPRETNPREVSPREINPREVRPRKEQPEDLGPIWDDAMIKSAQDWIGTLLPLMDISVPYNINPSRFHLRIEFSGSVLPDKNKQKHLFAVLSGLLMTMLKREYKRPLRGYKIVLTEV
jgi:predicted RNA-binding protein Jag